MRQLAICVLATAALLVAGRPAAARPTVAIAGIDVEGDGVGVDVESVGIARELSRAMRRAAERPEKPLQPIDPMMVADDVEALVWGKLIRDGDSWVVTVHLSAVGADGDTVSYRATIARDATSSQQLATLGTAIYDALLDQIELAGDDAVLRRRASPPVDAPADAFTTRVPDAATAAAATADDNAPALTVPPSIDMSRELAHPGPRPEPSAHDGARRLFWISAGIAAASAIVWIDAAVQIDDAEDQIADLAGCSGCDRAIAAANAKGNRWEGVSWLAGTATVAGTAAALLFGYQGFIAGRRAAPAELVGAARDADRAVGFAPLVGPDRIGAGVAGAF